MDRRCSHIFVIWRLPRLCAEIHWYILTGPKLTKRSNVASILGEELKSVSSSFQTQVSRTFSCNSAQVPSIASERGDQWEDIKPDRTMDGL